MAKFRPRAASRRDYQSTVTAFIAVMVPFVGIVVAGIFLNDKGAILTGTLVFSLLCAGLGLYQDHQNDLREADAKAEAKLTATSAVE